MGIRTARTMQGMPIQGILHPHSVYLSAATSKGATKNIMLISNIEHSYSRYNSLVIIIR